MHVQSATRWESARNSRTRIGPSWVWTLTSSGLCFELPNQEIEQLPNERRWKFEPLQKWQLNFIFFLSLIAMPQQEFPWFAPATPIADLFVRTTPEQKTDFGTKGPVREKCA